MVGRLVAWSDVCFRTAKATGFEGTDEELGELFVAIAGSGAKTLSLPNIEEWYKAETVRARKASADSQHVMISYSWANQPTVRRDTNLSICVENILVALCFLKLLSDERVNRSIVTRAHAPR